ncbi:MAG: fused MFS/spermidine synthase [Candidatus Eisenbacteria bacterium]
MTPRSMYRFCLICFFLSGATGLVYEVAWVRMLSLIFGVTSFAVATVLAAFMGGLGLGAYLFGRWAHRMRNPLRVYGWLEAAIGAYALLVPVIFRLLHPVYLSFERAFGEGDDLVRFGAIRFLLAAAVLVPPTLLMGGSLPLLVRRFAGSKDGGNTGSRVGVLYGVNTLGAVLGTASAGFLLLPELGMAGTIRFAAALNFLLALAVILLARREGGAPFGEEEEKGAERETEGPSGTLPLVLGAFFLCGALSMCYEVYWTRVLVLIVGPSVYAFTLMLTAFLAGLSLGSIAISPLLRRTKNLILLFGGLELFVAVACFGTMLLFSRYPYWFVRLSQGLGDRPFLFDALRFSFSLLTMLLPTLAMGAAFPVVAALHYREKRWIGRSVGNVYAFNTAGGILGSFLAGFLFLPVLGVRNGMALFVSLNALIGFVLALRARPGRWRNGVLGGAAAGLVIVLLIQQAGNLPVWDKKRMTVGPYQNALRRLATSPERLEQFLERFELLYYAEGITSTVTVRENNGVRTMQTNGKTDASSGVDMRTQVAIGQIPMVLHGPAERVLVIGLASGVSAAQALIQGARSVDIVEIERAMIGGARFFAAENRDLLEDPRARILVNDGRNHLLASETSYDVVVSQPSNPWISGINNLFTEEAFELIKRRLAPGGVVSQWIQYYGMSREDLFSVLHTFASVFEYVDVFLPARGDLVLLGSRNPILFDFPKIEERLSSPAARAALEEVSITNPYVLMTMYLFTIHRDENDRAWRAVRKAPLNRDDNMLLEFSAPRHIDDPGVFGNRDALALLHDRTKLHEASGNAHLALADGAVRLWDLPVAYLEIAEEEKRPDPDRVGIHNLKARILLARAGWENEPRLAALARTEAGLALKLDSLSSEAHLLLGTAAMREGDWGEAERCLREAMRLGEDRAVTGVYLGVALEQAGRKEEAIEAYRDAVAANPELPQALEGLRRLLGTRERRRP